ncbi:MAG: MBL fold metallo-hydrolase [Thermoanaerobaculia bacterium]
MTKTTRVRMYNVGLGDCFLLSFPTDKGERRVLVDCGTHSSGPGPLPAGDVAEKIIEEVRDEHGVPRIDVVIATHRHRDHVSGFESDAWSEVVVKEVWMPWTEDPDDEEAARILAKQAAKAKKVHKALLAASAPDDQIKIAENSLTNARAMSTLHRGFAGSPKRRFLPRTKTTGETIRSSALPGVKVHVLGPSRDPEVIRDMTPPKGETYLRLTDGTLGNEYEPPFPDRWRLVPKDADVIEWWDANLVAGEGARLPAPGAGLDAPRALAAWIASLGISSRWLRHVDDAAAEDALALVVALDKAVNGTSLMLMFEAGKSFLLFPGDAQWGTWLAAMENARTKRLLERTTFLKVGHHGSHNATPMDFVEDVLPDTFRGMVCTLATKKFPEIPRIPLLERLIEKGGQVVRSDIPEELEGFTVEGDHYVETLLPW